MTTKRKRLNITLSDQVWDLVNEVHALTGTAKSAVISEILDEVAPVFALQIEALRKLKESPREAQRLMQNFANQSISELAQMQLQVDAAFDARTVKGKRAKEGGYVGPARK